MSFPPCFALRARREFLYYQVRSRSAPAVLISSFALLLSSALGASALADVYDVTISDVTPRAFSVIWMSDTPVAAATIQVFADAEGFDEITDDLDVETISAGYASAHDRGIVKIDVTSDIISLEPDTVYYLRTRTESRDTPPVLMEYPLPTEPLLEVQTAVAVAVSQAADPSLPIANDLYHQVLYDPDGADSPDGALMLIWVPGLSPYPISSFVGEGASAPVAIADLNNLFGEDGYSVQVPAGEPLEVVEFRGSVCGPDQHMLVRKRRAPAELDTPVTELLAADACFAPDGVAADFDCNRRIGLTDFGSFASRYGQESSECVFNSDYDFDLNGRIGLADFGLFASVYGAEESAE